MSLSKINKEHLIKTLIDNTPAAYIILDEDYKIHYINEAFLNLRKLQKDKTLGEKCYNISNNGIPCNKCAVRQTLENGEKHLIQRKDILKDGTVKYIDDYSIPIKNDKKTNKKYVLELMINRSEEYNLRAKLWEKYSIILKYFLNIIEIKDEYTKKHSENVQKISCQIGEFMNLKDEDIFKLSLSSVLHDIGKVKVPFSILSKPGRLTDEEYEKIKMHSIYSKEILDNMESFNEIKFYAMYHHERIDGKGYPKGLKGDEIPLFSKIIAIADAYDAMISNRCYRKSLDENFALEEIRKGIGTQFDSECATAFLNMKKSEKFKTINTSNNKVERVLNKELVVSKSKETENLENILDDDIFSKIWDDTPYGYGLFDLNEKLIISNKTFRTQLDLPNKLVDEHYSYQLFSNKDFKLKKKISHGKNKLEKTTLTYKNIKSFDALIVPYEDMNISAVLLILIDRTEERQMEKQLYNDFNNLYNKLFNIIDNLFKNDETDKPLLEHKEKINSIKEKLLKLKKTITFDEF